MSTITKVGQPQLDLAMGNVLVHSAITEYLIYYTGSGEEVYFVHSSGEGLLSVTVRQMASHYGDLCGVLSILCRKEQTHEVALLYNNPLSR